MKVSIKALTALALVALITTACGGGDTPSPSGRSPMTHEEVAQEFLARYRAEFVGFDLELVKTQSLQSDYIVAYDRSLDSYNAYYIGSFNSGDDFVTYWSEYKYLFHFQLMAEDGGTYFDFFTNTRFEKTVASSKNLSKMKAIKEQLAIGKMADKLQADYGLSAEKSLDAARFAYKIEKSPKGTYNSKDYDAFSKELVGSTITEFQNDVKEGNFDSLSKRISTAADTTGMGPEGVNTLIKEMFLGK